ncbi:glycosyltransferase [Terribacillus sp. AE2B 122]|uniref:glycosyltransferase n=1 Tax=Terribacillus sp. AE2B 122 TaxID=1331902 RepID=UPI001584073A|nr:glycosyltransferase [Terribacillus sp. AE2B 122]
MGPFLSLCMIVKNEGKVLERCLQSVADHVDEIIIADTGSTDNTKEIAGKFNAKIYDYTWSNDFSAARNFAAEKANGEWILVLDADEYVSEENLKEAREELSQTKHSILAVNILNFTGDLWGDTAQHRHARVYKNDGNIEFHRTIHEQLKFMDGQELVVGLSPLVLYHTGYLNKTFKEKDKSSRNKELIELELINKKAFDYFNLGNELKIERKTEKALDAYINAYKLKEDHALDWIPFCLCNMTECLIELKRYDDALMVIRDASQIYANTADFIYLKGQIYLLQGRYDDAKEVFQSIIEKSHLYTAQVKSTDYRSYYPNMRLGYIFSQELNAYEAIKYYTKAINYNKYSVDAIVEVVKLLKEEHSDEEIMNFLEEKVFRSSYSNTVLQQIVIRLVENNQIPIAEKLYESNLREEAYFPELLRFKLDCIFNERNRIKMEAILYGVRNRILDASDILIMLWNNRGQEDALLHELHLVVKSSNLVGIQSLIFGSPGKAQNPVDINILLSLLDRALKYKNRSIVKRLLEVVNNECTSNKEVNSKVGNVLFANGYYTEAIDMYEAAKVSDSLELNAINNIVDYFIDKDKYGDALLFVFYAFEQDKFDFQTLKIGINILRVMGEYEDMEKLVLMGMDLYPDSVWLRNMYLEV